MNTSGYVWGNALVNAVNTDSSAHGLALYMQIGGETGQQMANTLASLSYPYIIQSQYRLTNAVGPTGSVPISVYGYSDSSGVINVGSFNIFGLANLN